ncbi:PTS sugar transporter subunit IIC [Sporolactobacillus shoreicorticis]|uniref:PTS sugar transporter subunit IIC n=1 Tax=Sporolactobacillus shoreicorticis TaxID=1923877 RepID=A0ABW5RY79_9BACL|nr:PTS sugar transporter subunit IIC [Sporolactobacillus shoreicorticis]MCO7127921.1 PTS sugar transporter subunit IIC [Sporolactobacillus shoreicorticis]
MSDHEQRLTSKVFINKVLSGTALGIIVGLIPNAVLCAILKLLGDNSIALFISHAVVIFQVATPLLIGALIALQFGFKPMNMAVVAGAAYVGSGVTQFSPTLTNSATHTVGGYLSTGTGDLINTMITASLAVLMVLWIGNKFGSVGIVLSPIVIGGGAGTIGLILLPYVSYITTSLGKLINSFTTLQPILMSLLIACSFAILIISPISTVAIGMAIQLNGVSAGAAAMGVAVTSIVLVIHSWKVNKSGVTIAIALGAMKMMMPNLFRHPIILLPILMTTIFSAIPVALFSVSGVPTSAGFGLVGFVGPLASIDAGLSPLLALIIWIIIPVVVGLMIQFLFAKAMKLYKKEDVFRYLG